MELVDKFGLILHMKENLGMVNVMDGALYTLRVGPCITCSMKEDKRNIGEK